MRYVVEFISKDERQKCSYMLRDRDEAISLGKTLAKNQTFTVWREREVAEHYISWDILNTIQELCCQYENGENVYTRKGDD